MAEDYEPIVASTSSAEATGPISPERSGVGLTSHSWSRDCDEAAAELLRQYQAARSERELRRLGFATVLTLMRNLAGKFIGPLPVGAWVLLLAVSGLTFGYNLGGARALTEHETYVAGPAKQMLTDGDFLLPRIGEHLWVEKPPLPYWLSGATCWLFGEFSEWTVRLPSALAGIGVVLIVAGLNARWFGPAVGLLAGLAQSTCVYMVSYARLAEADMVLALVVVAAIGVFDRFRSAVDEGHSTASRRWRAAFWGLIAISGLAKGLLFGAVLVAAPCLVWDIWNRRGAISRSMFSLFGIALVFLVWAAWPALVAVREPIALEIWYDHLFGRISGRIDFNVKPVWYYLTTWPWQMLPWTPMLLVAAWPSLRRAWQSDRTPDRFLWCWALVPVLVLSISRGKHHHYLIYSLPALSSIVALGLRECGLRIREQTHHTLGLARFYSFALAPCVLVAGVVSAIVWSEYRLDAAVVSLVLAAAVMLLGYASSRRKTVLSCVAVAFPVVLGILYVHARVLPSRDPSLADREFLESVEAQLPAGVVPIVCGSGDVYGREIARHIFYLDRPVVSVWCPDRLGPCEETTFVVTRRSARSSLASLGQVSELAASTHSRGEQGPNDRFVLLKIEPSHSDTAEFASGGRMQLLP